jgi:hypothetical protein
MGREPARGKRRGLTSGVTREGFDGNVSGAHLFSTRQRSCPMPGSSASGIATHAGEACAAVGAREVATAGKRV